MALRTLDKTTTVISVGDGDTVLLPDIKEFTGDRLVLISVTASCKSYTLRPVAGQQINNAAGDTVIQGNSALFLHILVPTLSWGALVFAGTTGSETIHVTTDVTPLRIIADPTLVMTNNLLEIKGYDVGSGPAQFLVDDNGVLTMATNGGNAITVYGGSLNAHQYNDQPALTLIQEVGSPTSDVLRISSSGHVDGNLFKIGSAGALTSPTLLTTKLGMAEGFVTGSGTLTMSANSYVALFGSYTQVNLPAYAAGDTGWYWISNGQANSVKLAVQGSDLIYDTGTGGFVTFIQLGAGEVIHLSSVDGAVVGSPNKTVFGVLAKGSSCAAQRLTANAGANLAWGDRPTFFSGSAGGHTFVLPTIGNMGSGAQPITTMRFYNAATSAVTLTAGGSEVIFNSLSPTGGTASYTLNSNASVTLVSDSVSSPKSWKAVSENPGLRYGTATLSSGTIAVVDTSILAGTIICVQSALTTEAFGVVLSAGVGFTINSSNASSSASVKWIRVN